MLTPELGYRAKPWSALSCVIGRTDSLCPDFPVLHTHNEMVAGVTKLDVVVEDRGLYQYTKSTLARSSCHGLVR